MVVGDFPLNGKIAVVTGGGSGINLSFTRLALNSGAKVLIADLRLTSQAEETIKSSSGNAAHMTCDVSKWSDLESIPSEVEKAFGKGSVADVWVAGAGIFEPHWSSFLYDEEKEFYMQIRINAEHPMKLTRIAMRSLLGANKPGVVLLVASMAGVLGVYSGALYCASKHAVIGFTKSMSPADEEENVKIVAICPGMVATPLWTGNAAKEVNAQWSYDESMCIQPEEVAEAMKDAVTLGKYKGGTMLEVSKARLRGELEGEQAVVVAGEEEQRKWLTTNYEPLRKVWAGERGK